MLRFCGIVMRMTASADSFLCVARFDQFSPFQARHCSGLTSEALRGPPACIFTAKQDELHVCASLTHGQL